jgi:inner membrane protein
VSPITHGLLSWVLGERALQDNRDVALVATAGLLPDLDSLGVVLDLANRFLQRPPTDYYAALHHWLLHGAAGALLVAGGVSLAAREKAKVFALALVTFHLHLLCDVVGSRGPDPGEGIWPLYYWGPFSDRLGVWVWQDQWLLNGWQNVSLTVALLAWTFYVAWRWDRSPLLPWAARAHAALVSTLRQRFGLPSEQAC